jgi:hypothetical protein
VPRQRQHQFIRLNTAAVVADSNQAAAAALQFDLDPAGARVESVLHQFLDHGSRALDYLAGGDLADERIG